MSPEVPAMAVAPLPWPDLPDDLKDDAKAKEARATAIGTAIVDAEKAAREVPAARAQSSDDLNQKLAETLTTISTGAIERARSGAQFVQTASTAIAGLYTGVLGVLFVSDHAAPGRAFIPALFLGLAVALATYYLAFVVPGTRMQRPVFQNVNDADLWVRLNYVSMWARRIVFRRAGSLRAAVVCLFLGLVFLPIGVAKVPADVHIQFLPEPVDRPATTIDWPKPTILDTPQLSVALYTAQLEEFRENLPPAQSGPDSTARDDTAAWGLALLGLLIVLLVWWDPLGLWRPEEDPQVSLDPHPEIATNLVNTEAGT
jgi:hypothetical protein